MRFDKYNKWTLGIILVLLSGCIHEEDDTEITKLDPDPNITIPDTGVAGKPDVLQKAESCTDFKTYLTQNLIEQYLDNQSDRWGYCPFCFGIGIAEDGVAVPTIGTGGAETSDLSTRDPGSVTGTNVQEVGVDELDKVKTDSLGNLYLTENKTLYIFDAFPPEDMQQLTGMDIENEPLGLFVDEDNKRLVVLTSEWIQQEIYNSDSRYPYKYSLPKVNILFIDVSELSSPQLSKVIQLDGNYQSARFINNRLHLVLNHWLRNIDESFATRQFQEDLDKYWEAKYWDFDSLQNDIATLREKLATQIVTGVNSLDVNEVLPNKQINTGNEQLLLQCDEVYHPEVAIKSAGMLSVNSMDSDGENHISVGAMASGGLVYATQDNLYVAQMSNGWWWSFEDQKTVIHQFALSDIAPDYIGSGMVAGMLNNQFSLSEFEGYLRVATSERSWPADATRAEQYNHLFILKENAGKLELAGSVEKFAPDERIYSVRYLGNRGFVVTFRNTDPLFSFDLSDPENPVITGELEIPGFSTYMHPIDENHLLTIGKAGDEQGATSETQLQIFNISDMQNPVRIAAHIPQILQDNEGWGYSIAESDHHAFTYAPDDKILAIPLSYYDWKNHDSFAGIATFSIDINEGIGENGVVDHSDFIHEADCGKKIDEIGVVYDENCIDNFYRWQAQPNRSVIMQDSEGNNSYLYSISRLGVKANDLNAMQETLKALALQE